MGGHGWEGEGTGLSPRGLKVERQVGGGGRPGWRGSPGSGDGVLICGVAMVSYRFF